MAEKEPYKPGLVKNQTLVQQLKEFQRNPRSLVFVTLAETYRSENLPHQALEILEEGLAIHPGLTSALLAKARSLFDLRRYAEASGVCSEALQRNAENLKAHKLQAEIFVRLGQRRAAIRSLTKVVSLYPQDRDAVKALEELENLETGQLIPLEKVSRASVDAPPTLGKIEEFQVNSFRESLAAIAKEGLLPALESAEPAEKSADEDESENEPEDEGQEPTFATRTIAELYLRQGLRAKAHRVLRKILQNDPGHAWARETLQDLGTDGIVAPTQKPQLPAPRILLERKAKVLERLLAQVRMRKTREGA